MFSRRFITLLTMVVVIGMAANPARAARGGPDAFGYTWADSDEPDVSTVVPAFDNSWTFAIWNDELADPIPVGFDFPFYGAMVTTVLISDNGFLSFGLPPSSAPVNARIPDAAPPQYLIAYFWRDIESSYLQYQGSFAGGQGFRVQLKADIPGSTTPLECNVLLYSNGVIRIVYKTVDRVDTATIGIENGAGTEGTQLAYNGQFAGSFRPRNAYAVQFNPRGQLNCAVVQDLSCSTSPGTYTTPATVNPNINSYFGCSGATYNGNERVFRLDLPALSDLELTLSNFGSRNLDLFLLSACSEFACAGGGGDALSAPMLDAGTYYVVVDGLTAADNGSFNLLADCSQKSYSITCGDVGLRGATSGVSSFNGYSCLAGDYSGPESLYMFNFTGPGHIHATLNDLTNPSVSNLDVLMFAGTRPDPPQCLAGGDDSAVLFNAPDGAYTITVDGLDIGSGPSEGAFELSLQCGVLLDCSTPAGTLACNQTLDATTDVPSLANAVQDYACASGIFDGNEAVYRFDNPFDQDVSFVVEGDPAFRLFLVGNLCDEGTCTASFNGAVTRLAMPPGTTYVVVDAEAGYAGPFALTTVCGNTVEPKTLQLTLSEGEQYNEHKTLFLNPSVRKADLLFVLDTNLSSGPALAALRNEIARILLTAGEEFQDVQAGLVSHRDYAGSPSQGAGPCPYDAEYGQGAAYPYMLELPISADLAAFQTALYALAADGGGDHPESYLRAYWESAVDPAVGWRPNAQRFIFGFGHWFPHLCDASPCIIPLGLDGYPGGIDPGRDGVAGTSDDLVLDDVIARIREIDATFIYWSAPTPLTLPAFPGMIAFWECVTSQLGGFVVPTFNGVPRDRQGTDDGIRSRFTSSMASCATLEVETTAGYANWISLVTPPFMTDAPLPGVPQFDITFSPPGGTPDGSYTFDVLFVCDGVVMTWQDVQIDVASTPCSASAEAGAAPAPVCAGTPLTLDGSASTMSGCTTQRLYRWLDPASGVACDWSPSPTCDLSPQTGGTYTLEVQCEKRPTCSASDTIDLTVLPTPEAKVGENPRALCVGDQADLGEGPGDPSSTTYSWAPPDNLSDPAIANPTFTAVTEGQVTYTLTVTDRSSNCSKQETLTIDVVAGRATTDVGNTLMQVKNGQDVDLSWGPLVFRNYNVHRAAAVAEIDRANYLAPVVHSLTNAESWTDAGALTLPDPLNFYQVYPRDCDGTSIIP